MKEQVKNGAASFYAVIFTALMMTVLVLSFVRLMLSEQSQTSGDDLSTSAYDAALAGVEDAKTLLKICAQNPTDSRCAALYSEDCAALSQALHGTDEGAVDESGEQYYTCVKMSNLTDDYRVTISGDSQRVAMVPLKAEGDFDTVVVEWSSATNKNLETGVSGIPTLPVTSQSPTPAMVTAQLLNGQNLSAVWNDGKTRGSMSVLYPAKDSGTDTVSTAEINERANLAVKNTPKYIKCTVAATKTTCTANLKVGGTSYGQNGDYLLLSTPYGGEGADFVITLKNGSSTVKFQDAQVSVDSTGRTYDRYRRVESRVNMTNVSLYPEFTLQLDGDGDDGQLKKSFYVTRNCWSAASGKKADCKNSGEI